MGLAAQLIVWDDDFCRLLASKGFWVVRFDNRDIGLSTTFATSRTPSFAEMLFAQVTGLRFRVPYTLRDMAADTAGLMDALGIGTAHVVGASMGGAIAQELAMQFPQRLRTVTSIMSSTGDPKLPRAQTRALAVLMRKTPAKREPFVRQYVDAWHVLAGDHFPFDAVRMQRQGEATFDRGINPPGVARQLMAIIASGNRTAALRSVRVPVLVVHGTLDPLVPYEGGLATAQAIPDAKLVLLPGMGHTLPREVWPRLADEIAKHAATA